MKKTLVALTLSLFAASSFAYPIVKSDNGNLFVTGQFRLAHSDFQFQDSDSVRNSARIRLQLGGNFKVSDAGDKVGFFTRLQKEFYSQKVTLKTAEGQSATKSHNGNVPQFTIISFYLDSVNYGKFTLGLKGVKSLADSELYNTPSVLLDGYLTAYGIATWEKSDRSVLWHSPKFKNTQVALGYSDYHNTTSKEYQRTLSGLASYKFTPEFSTYLVGTYTTDSLNSANVKKSGSVDLNGRYYNKGLAINFDLGYGFSEGVGEQADKNSFVVYGASVQYKVHNLFTPYISLGGSQNHSTKWVAQTTSSSSEKSTDSSTSQKVKTTKNVNVVRGAVGVSSQLYKDQYQSLQLSLDYDYIKESDKKDTNKYGVALIYRF